MLLKIPLNTYRFGISASFIPKRNFSIFKPFYPKINSIYKKIVPSSYQPVKKIIPIKSFIFKELSGIKKYPTLFTGNFSLPKEKNYLIQKRFFSDKKDHDKDKKSASILEKIMIKYMVICFTISTTIFCSMLLLSFFDIDPQDYPTWVPVDFLYNIIGYSTWYCLIVILIYILFF
jgi:hypothetical protein